MTVDGALNWFQAGLDGRDVRSLAIAPDSSVIYAGTFDEGVFRSTDGGQIWAGVSAGLSSLAVRALAINPSAPSVVFAGTDTGVYARYGGGPWILADDVAGSRVSALAVEAGAPNVIYAATLGAGVWISVDGGDRWVAHNQGLTGSLEVYSLAIDPREPAPGRLRTVHAGTFGAGVFSITLEPDVFADGLESGDAAAWSASAGPDGR